MATSENFLRSYLSGGMDRPPSPARRGLGALLNRFPAAEVEWVDGQPSTEMDVLDAESRQVVGSLGARSEGPWLMVKLDVDPRPFAIWKSTGAVYREDEHGAVGDDPFLSPERPI